MKKIISVLLIWLLVLGSGSAMAQGGKLYWVMEIPALNEEEGEYYPYQYDENWDHVIEKRVIKSLDLETGLVEEREILTDWIPLKSNEEGLFFAVWTDPGLADVRVWNGETMEIVESGLIMPEGMEPEAYENGWLYGMRQERDFSSDHTRIVWGRTDKDGFESIQINAAGSLDYLYTPIVGDEVKLYHGMSLGDRQMLVQLYGMKTQTIVRFWGDSAYEAGLPEAAAQYGENQLLAWTDVDESVWSEDGLELYCGEYSEYGEWECWQAWIPYHVMTQLVMLDTYTGQYKPVQTEDGCDIFLTDMQVMGDSVYDSENGCLYVECWDDYPLAVCGTPLFERGYLRKGRRTLVRIHLATGEQTVLYEAGYARPEYEQMMEIFRKEYGAPLEEGEYSHPLSPEDQAIDDALFENKLLETNPAGEHEYFVYNFDIWLSEN